mmetsp:Transcript_79203/g.157482  ORF Transcript_79203/g.157482 Transcript_79203/m.157482 type:complete len:196 (-) Transcript_79203:119-706(-)
MTFIEFCTAAATVGVECDLTADSNEADESDDKPGSSTRRKQLTKRGSRLPSKKAKTDNHDSSHMLVAISSIKHWVGGGRQQQCGVAGCPCGFYCLKCSHDSLPTSIKVVHPPEVGGGKYLCLKTHKRDPAKTACTWCMPTPRKTTKRKRKDQCPFTRPTRFGTVLYSIWTGTRNGCNGTPDMACKCRFGVGLGCK